MRTQELIENTFADFRKYLKNVAGIEPNKFSTDAWMTLLLHAHFSAYQAMLQKFRAEQVRKQAEKAASDGEGDSGADHNWEDAEFVTIWDGGTEIKTSARFDRDTGLIEVLEKAEDSSVQTLDDQYLRRGDGSRLDVYESGGGLYARLEEVATQEPKEEIAS